MKQLKIAALLLALACGVSAQVTNPTASVSISGTVNVAGVKSSNGGAPGATNLGVLPAVANAAAPSFTEARQVALSTDLAGNLRALQFLSDGVNPYVALGCTNQALINLTNASLTQIIAISGSLQPYICHIAYAGPAPGDFKLQYGTGSNCGSGTTDLTALFKSVQSFDFSYPMGSPLRGVASNAICAIQTTSQAAGIQVIYGYK